MAKQSASIFIIDDHPLIRRALTYLIKRDPELEVCGEAATSGEALKGIDSLKPDLIIIDLKLQDGSGIELIKQIKARRPDAKLLAHSMYEEPSFIERALRAGASGYVHKGDDEEDVLKAIHDVFDGKLYIGGEMKDHLLSRTLNSGVVTEDPLAKLSDREMEVFRLIGEGLGVREIADKLCLSPKTVETYRSGIKNKLGLESSRDVVRQATQWMLDQ